MSFNHSIFPEKKGNVLLQLVIDGTIAGVAYVQFVKCTIKKSVWKSRFLCILKFNLNVFYLSTFYKMITYASILSSSAVMIVHLTNKAYRPPLETTN